jgi:UDP-glucose:(heptosyl)LPS alpha-1,3-glucosyltransferase
VIGFNRTWHQDVYLAVAGAGPTAVRSGLARYRNLVRRGLSTLGKWVSPKQHLFRRIERKQFVDRRPHVIACSRLSARHFQADFDVPVENLSVVYNGFEPATLPVDGAAVRAAFRRSHGLGDGVTAVLFAAHNYRLKGLEPLIEAFALIAASRPNAMLVVCGSPHDGRFRRLAERRGVADRVKFLGFVDDPAECFLGCDLFAYPTFYDPCSLVVPEALYAGLPVITSGANGAGELLEEEHTGFVVPDPWDTATLSKRLARLIDDPKLRTKMSVRAREQAGKMTIDARMRELSDVFNRVVAERREPPRPVRRAA